MGNVLIDDTYLTEIANSIRNKLDTSIKFKPSEMANGIASIPGGVGKRFADIQTTHESPITLVPNDFKQGTTLRAGAFCYDTGYGSNSLLAQYEKTIETIIFPEAGVIDTPTSIGTDGGFFSYNTTIKSVYFNGLITSKVTVLYETFKNCTALVLVDFGQSDTSNVTDMRHMFTGCTSLENIDFSSLDLSKNPMMYHTFYNCSNLISVIFPSTISKIQPYVYDSHDPLFKGCSKLQSFTILATTPPTLNRNYGDPIFPSSGQNEGMKIYVPAASVDIYKTETNWSYYADIIRAIP